MICLIYDGNGASTATLVFITCIWVPFMQFKNAIFKIISVTMMLFRLQHHRHDHDVNHDYNMFWKVFPNIYHFISLRSYDAASDLDDGFADKVVDDICSICLHEFADEGVVSQLNTCGHVFHKSCIEGWLDHAHFTCPLCRSNLLNVLHKHVL
ncbi:hypothetical protein R6Q57_003011 [Mikania cordata]